MITLAAISIIPALVSLGFDFLLKKTGFGKISYALQQVIIGITFGILAIFFTECGVDIGNAIANIRDSAPLCAGLLFGGPAGIIAGIIGGAYRWFCVYWGGGMFTRLACSIAVVVAGFAAAGARKYMFEGKRPGFGFGAGLAIGMEVIHMMLILMTNVDNMSEAFDFVDTCAAIMIAFNAIAMALAAFAVGKKSFKMPKPFPILQMFTMGLLLCFLALFGISFGLTYTVTVSIQDASNEELLSLNLDDVETSLEENGITENISTWRVGKSGGIVVCDETGSILSISRNGKAVNPDTNAIDMEEELQPNTFYSTEINNEQVYCEYRNTGNYYVFAYMTATEADLASYILFYMMLFTEIWIYITIFFLVYQIVKKTMIDKLVEVNDGLKQITAGDLDTVIAVQSSQEFAVLSEEVNHTVDSLKELIKDAETRIERELELSRQIQKTAVPFIFPPFPKRKDFDIYALMNTAKEVGGDFYDFYFTDDKHFAFLIADVSGKGIPAAMFMMASKTLIKGLAERGKSVEEVFRETNDSLCDGNDAGMFVTAWMGVINLETGHMQYANAGHNPPLLCRKNEDYTFIREKPNFVLAGMEGTPYKKHELYINPGDTLYLYTDGVTEAENQDHKLYGEDRLERVLQRSVGLTPEETCHEVERDVAAFAENAPQSDDVTMLAFRLNYLQSPNSICVYPDSASLELVTNYVDQKLSKLNISASVRNKVQITVDEIFSNIQQYGSATKAEIRFGFEEEHLGITFTDNGKPFDPTKAETPDTTLSAEERKIGGLGIYLVNQLSSACTYEYKDHRNCLNVVFDLKEQGEQK